MSNEIYSHILQKAFVKNFAKSGIVSYVVHGTNEKGSFNINDWAKDQPIAEKGFYPYEIEKGINRLENDGINVIRKILLNSQTPCNSIELTRKETIILKFYYCLSQTRTKLNRENMRLYRGDLLFNHLHREDKRDAKEKQCADMKELIEMYDDFLNDDYSKFSSRISEIIPIRNNDPLGTLKQMNINRVLNSDLKIIRFDTLNLLLHENANFHEGSGFIAYEFWVIAPNLAIIFRDNSISFKVLKKMYESKIFENEILHNETKIMYRKSKEILSARNKFFNGKDNTVKVQYEFDTKEAPKYFCNDDIFDIQIFEKDRGTLTLCNAMMLIHSNKSFVIYQNEDDIKNAEKIIKEGKVFRIEDN